MVGLQALISFSNGVQRPLRSRLKYEPDDPVRRKTCNKVMKRLTSSSIRLKRGIKWLTIGDMDEINEYLLIILGFVSSRPLEKFCSPHQAHIY